MHDDGMTRLVRDLANALWCVESALSAPFDPPRARTAVDRLRAALDAAEAAVEGRALEHERELRERDARTREGRRLRRYRVSTTWCGATYSDAEDLLAAVAGPGPFPGKVESSTHAREGVRYVTLTWRTGPIPRRVLELALVAQGDRAERAARGWVRTGAVIAPDLARVFGPPEGLPPVPRRRLSPSPSGAA